MMSLGRLLHLRRIVTRRGDFGGGKLVAVFVVDTFVGTRFSSRFLLPATLRVGGRRFLTFLSLFVLLSLVLEVGGDFGGGMHSQFVNRLRLLSVGSSCKHIMLLLVSSASLSSASVNSLLTLLLFPGLALQLNVKDDRREDFPVKQGEY